LSRAHRLGKKLRGGRAILVGGPMSNEVLQMRAGSKYIGEGNGDVFGKRGD
jgi:hypothetical protein